MRGWLTCAAALVVAVLVTVGVSAQVPHYGTATIYAQRLNSISNRSVYLTDAEIATRLGPTWAAWWCANSYRQFGCTGFDVRIEPVLTMDDAAQPENYNQCPNATFGLPAFGTSAIIAKYGNTGWVSGYKMQFLPVYNCWAVAQGGAGGGGSMFFQPTLTAGNWAHEFGHALGVTQSGTWFQGNEGHAQAEHCDSAGCSVEEYGGANTYDLMGRGNGYTLDSGRGQFSAWNKARAGWLTSPEIMLMIPGYLSPRDATRPHIAVMTQPGDCVLEPLERPLTPTGIVACAVRLPSSTSTGLLMVEARVDGDKLGNNAGVIVYEGFPGSTKLRDFEHVYVNVDKYALVAGESGTLADGVTFDVLAFDKSGARVRVRTPGVQPLPSPCGGSCKPSKPGKPAIH